MNPTDFKSRESITVDLIWDHYETMSITRGMQLQQAIAIAKRMRIGLYEMGALAGAFHAKSHKAIRPDNRMMDECVKNGIFPPCVGLQFLMFDNSIKLMRGGKPKLLQPVHLLNSDETYD